MYFTYICIGLVSILFSCALFDFSLVVIALLLLQQAFVANFHQNYYLLYATPIKNPQNPQNTKQSNHKHQLESIDIQ